MGVQQSKKVKQKEKQPFEKDTKNGTGKEAAAETAPDCTHGETNDVTEHPTNADNASQGLGPTQLISHQKEPKNGSEAVLTRMHQVPAVDAPQNREQSIDKAVNITQDADPGKYNPFLASAKKVTQQHTSPVKPKLQQAVPARPTWGPCCGLAVSAVQFDSLKSDVLQQPQDVPKTLSPQQSGPSTQAQQRRDKREPHEKTADPAHTSDVSASAQVTAQVFGKDTPGQAGCSFGTQELHKMIPQFPAFHMQEPVRHSYREAVREVATENLHSKKEEAQAKTKNKPQKSNFNVSNNSHSLFLVNETSTDVTCHATDIAKQSTATMPGTAQVPTTNPTTYFKLSKSQVNSSVNGRHKHCLKLAKKARDNCLQSQQTARETVTTVQESSEPQGCTAMEENPIKKQETHQIPQHNKANNVTYGNILSCMQTVSMSGRAPQVSVVEGVHSAAQINAADDPTTAASDTSVKLRLQCEFQVSVPQDTAARPMNECTHKALDQSQPDNTRSDTVSDEINGKNGEQEEQQEPGVIPAVPEHKGAEGRWPPFTVSQSCPHKVHCQHTPGTGLPPNVQKWCDEDPNNLCEPPWVTTARFAACLALRDVQQEEDGSHQ